MNNDKRSIGWIALQGIAIVAGILLAFGIEAWWNELEDREEEERILTALSNELRANIKTLDGELTFHSAVRDSAQRLLQASSGAIQLPPDEIDRHVGSLLWWSKSNIASTVLTGIVDSGKLSLIEDTDLQSRIASLSVYYGNLDDMGNQLYDTFKAILMPYLHKHSLVPQLSNAQLSSPGTGIYAQPRLPVSIKRDHSDLLSDQEFVGVTTNVFWDHNDALTAVTRSKSYLESLAQDIESR